MGDVQPITVEIHGRDYELVASRVARFREEHPEHTIETQLIKDEPDRVVMKALIMDGERLLATGYAEEDRAASSINKSSAMENCETSAIGRCLAAMGYIGAGAYRSADEMNTALFEQKIKNLHTQFAETTQANERNHESLIAIRGFLLEDNFDAARECWNEVSHDDQKAIWRATTKGGWFTTRERQQMKYWSNEFETGRNNNG